MSGRAMAVGLVGALIALGLALLVAGTCSSCGDDVPPTPDAGECLRWSPTICTPAGCCVDAGEDGAP